MNFKRLACCVGVLLVSTGICAAESTRGFPQLADALDRLSKRQVAQRLSAAYADIAARNLFSGVVLLAKGDQVLFQGAYGLANRDWNIENTPGTRFNLASANKMFTAVLIAQLVEQGKLGYGDTLDKYLDSSWIKPEIAAKIRIEHLLAHTSGLGSFFNAKFMATPPVKLKSIDDFKPIVSGSELSFEPGTKWAYSNTGFLLLGAVIEKVTGKSYFEQVRASITGPLGMTSTDALDLEEVNPNVAIGYAMEPKVQRPMSPPPGMRPGELPKFDDIMRQTAKMLQAVNDDGFQWKNNLFRHVVKGGPAGAYFTTASDMLRFLDGFSRGKLVSAATVQLMTSPKPGSAQYGYGMQVEEGAYGHTGGYIGISTAAFALPHDYRFIVLANVSGEISTAWVAAYDALSR